MVKISLKTNFQFHNKKYLPNFFLYILKKSANKENEKMENIISEKLVRKCIYIYIILNLTQYVPNKR